MVLSKHFVTIKTHLKRLIFDSIFWRFTSLFFQASNLLNV